MSHKFRWAAVAFAAAALAAGCGSDDDNDTASDNPTAPPAETTSADKPDSSAETTSKISMKSIQFAPKDATVKVGEEVTWTNDEGIDHNVVATSGADFESEIFGEGGTYKFTPAKAGTIDYTCTLHPGMDGKLNVTE